nr:phage tail tape measure protein [Arthrobacter sp. zg-Y20]
MGFGAAAVAVAALSITKFAEFDKAMSGVEAATHASADEMGIFRQAAMEAGADTAYSAEEAAGAIEELSKAGVSADDILGGGLTGSLSLAAAGAMDVGQAAELAATAMTQFGLSGQDIPHIADLLAAGAGKAQGSVEDLGMALNQSGLVAAATGVTIESATGTLAAFASAGLVGSDAGTSLKSMLQHLQAPSSVAAAEMEKIGINMYNANGEFIGMTALAEQLQTNMADLTQEERDHSSAVIFGADAVRAANVLYKQGGEGIQDWTDKVNDAGYAATTAAILQDNLSGDLEKLGGSMETVFIKGGGSASEALRTLVQAGESAVDMIGKIPTPALESGIAMAGTAGSVALVGGAFMTLLPKVMEGVKNFRNLGSEGGRLPGTLGKVAKGATIAAVAIGALAAIGKATSHDFSPSVEQMANSVLKLSKSGEGVSSLDGMFSEWGTFFGSETIQGVDGVSDAVSRLVEESTNKMGRFESGVVDLFQMVGHEGGVLTQLKDRFNQVGDSLGDLVSNGAADTAALSFNKLATEFEKNGQSAQDALDIMPGYRDSLIALGQSVGVDLQDWEILDMAMGKIPPRMEAAGFSAEGLTTVVGSMTSVTGDAIPITEDMAKALEEMGLTASGAVAQLDKYVDLLVRAGLANLSSRDAQRGAVEAQVAFNEALAANGPNLDINTKAGRDNAAAMDGVAGARIALLQAMASETDAYGNNIHTQEEMQGVLSETYTQLYDNALAMTGNADAANALAREAMGIPKEVNIDTWMSDYAKQMAEGTTGAIASTGEQATDLEIQLGNLHSQIQGLPNKEIIITEPMSPEVKLGLENLGYVVETLPDGTIKVSETGTDATGQKITDVAKQERIALIDARALTDAANAALNKVAENRTAVITATMNILRGRDDTAGWGGTPYAPGKGPGGAGGGKVQDLFMAGLAGGGIVPGAPPRDQRVDNVLASVNGRPLAVQSGEWIVNGASSRKHDRLLLGINRDEPWVSELMGYARGGVPFRSEYPVGASLSGMATGAGNVYYQTVQVDYSGPEVGAIVEAVVRRLQNI